MRLELVSSVDATTPQDKAQLQAKLMRLAREVFPAAAAQGGYPVRFDHCFLRIVYDNVFQQQWQQVLPKGQPAYKQLSTEQLEEAIGIGQLIIEDAQACAELNAKSLGWRGKG